MNAAGMLGFSPNFRDSLPYDDFGVFVTNPISLRQRLPAARPELINFPGGLLLHTGLPNPGFKSVLQKYAGKWVRSVLPVMVHLMADRPEETVRMVRSLEGLENIAAIELGFAPKLAGDIILMVVEMCSGELPLVVSLESGQILSLAPKVIEAGAAAVSMAAPRGALSGEEGGLVTGRLYGPSLFPQALEVVHSAARLGLPVIAAGGLFSSENCKAAMTAGALACQLDTVLWNSS